MKTSKIILIILISLFILLFLIRLTTPREISENKTWCQEILSLNKTLGMHGITHSYHEFKNYVNETELIEAKQIFKDCFGYEPTLFKPPYLKLSKENKELLEKNNLEIKWIWNQNLHKVYHCQDSGLFPNKFHDVF